MMNGLVSVLVAIVGVATLAVIFGKNARTAEVLTAGGNAFSAALVAAETPVLDGYSLRVPSTGGLHF